MPICSRGIVGECVDSPESGKTCHGSPAVHCPCSAIHDYYTVGIHDTRLYLETRPLSAAVFLLHLPENPV